jgi:hypothetical protein
MKFKNFRLPTTFVATLAVGLLLSGCNNPASSDDDHGEHEHAEGAVLKMNGAEIVRIENGQVQSGQIEVDEGEETPLVTIYFLSEDGDEFQPDDPEYSLRWDKIDEAIAEVEQHDEDGKWEFHIHGLSSGNTTVRFRLWHESENHSDFDTPEIDVIVN